MKLSQVLKDWPEYRLNDDAPPNEVFDNEAWNDAVDSCDREIDREALWKLIVSRSVYHNFDSDKDNFITVPLNDLTDLIISTMPNWMKKV